MNWFELSERVIVIRTNESKELARGIRAANVSEIIDVIPTETELAIQHCASNPADLMARIATMQPMKLEPSEEILEVPVCYDLEMDMAEIVKSSGLLTAQIIELHCSIIYTVSHGFIPGFMYLEGLPEILHCARKDDPRTQLPRGAVGIGGNKTGIYSLPSPGGWQIIGISPLDLFDISKENPFSIPDQARVRFKPIAKQEFDDWD